ncbi:hypothetical protein ACP275_04G001400 [Erythranthe tilingii]
MAMAAAAEPLLVPNPPPPPPPPPQHYDDDDDVDISNSPLVYEHHHYGSEDDVEDPFFPNSPPPPPPPQSSSSSSWSRKKMKRCNTAPAMAAMKDFRTHHSADDPNYLRQSDSSYLLRQAAVLLILYLSLGVVIYSFNRDHFSGIETHPVVDALYFCIVTMCTIGYGDIAPVTPIAKVFACVFVLVGFGFIDILLSGVVNNVLDMQENMILAGIEAGPPRQNRQENHEEEHHHHPRRFFARNYIIDVAKGRMRIRLKVGLALGVVVMCIGMGFLFLYFVEDLDLLDSVYLSVMSVTTVGYGDTAFKTLTGRLFASVWLLFSTLAVARAFLYLAEARIDKRHRKITNWVLHRDITVEDLLAADTNHNGFISKSEYVIYKLKEMGKIKETDILQICNQFNKLDPNNSGKITLPHLFDNHL